MKRLTYDFCIGGNHCWQVKGADNLECREVCERQGDDGCKTCPIAKAFDRLAAIEDILGDEYDLDLVQKLIQAYREGRYIILKEPEQAGISRLRELGQADREGRCVVLPCKVGDTIYRVVHCDDGSGYAVWIIRVNFVEFNDNDSIELPNYVIGTTENGAGTTMEFSDFGKTAFTTREAAEEALKARKQDGNNK